MVGWLGQCSLQAGLPLLPRRVRTTGAEEGEAAGVAALSTRSGVQVVNEVKGGAWEDGPGVGAEPTPMAWKRPINGDSLRSTTNVHHQALVPVLYDPERAVLRGPQRAAVGVVANEHKIRRA